LPSAVIETPKYVGAEISKRVDRSRDLCGRIAFTSIEPSGIFVSKEAASAAWRK
jgi:hypothetical protein